MLVAVRRGVLHRQSSPRGMSGWVEKTGCRHRGGVREFSQLAQRSDGEGRVLFFPDDEANAGKIGGKTHPMRNSLRARTACWVLCTIAAAAVGLVFSETTERSIPTCEVRGRLGRRAADDC